MHCDEHEQPCCGLCGCTEHRKSERVDTIENAVQFLKENRQIDSLLTEVSTLKRKLMTAKTKEEQIFPLSKRQWTKMLPKMKKRFK